MKRIDSIIQSLKKIKNMSENLCLYVDLRVRMKQHLLLENGLTRLQTYIS